MVSDSKPQSRLQLALRGDLIYCSVERMLLCSDSWCTEWHAVTAWLTHNNNTQRGLHIRLSRGSAERRRLRKAGSTVCVSLGLAHEPLVSGAEPPGTFWKSEMSMCQGGADFPSSFSSVSFHCLFLPFLSLFKLQNQWIWTGKTSVCFRLQDSQFAYAWNAFLQRLFFAT